MMYMANAMNIVPARTKLTMVETLVISRTMKKAPLGLVGDPGAPMTPRTE